MTTKQYKMSDWEAYLRGKLNTLLLAAASTFFYFIAVYTYVNKFYLLTSIILFVSVLLISAAWACTRDGVIRRAWSKLMPSYDWAIHDIEVTYE